MRHQVYGRKLNRTSSHRKAMLKNLAAALFEHGEIRTTMPKAKAVQPLVEKIITIAKKNNLHARRQIEQRINDRMIHMWVGNASQSKLDNPYFDLPGAEEIEFNRYGEVRKAPRLVQHIMTKVAPRYAERAGGYTRIVKLAEHRLGDGTDYVLLQLVGEEDGPEVGGGVSRRRAASYKRAEFAAKLRKDAGGNDNAATAVAEEEAPAPEAEAAPDATDATTEEGTEEEKSE